MVKSVGRYETERLILACAVRNLTGIGGKRNRGFGQVECTIDDTSFDLETLGVHYGTSKYYDYR